VFRAELNEGKARGVMAWFAVLILAAVWVLFSSVFSARESLIA
jgi:hypothetical protein